MCLKMPTQQSEQRYGKNVSENANATGTLGIIINNHGLGGYASTSITMTPWSRAWAPQTKYQDKQT